MTPKDIKRMDEDFLAKMLEDYLYDDFEFTANIQKGHADDFHCGKTDIEILLRKIHDNKTMNSSFTDKETMANSIQTVLCYNIATICSWLQTGRRDFSNDDNYRKLVMSLDTREKDPVGYGFKGNSLNKYETRVVTVVLARDFEGLSPCGFYVESAFPDLTVAKKTNVSYDLNYVEGKFADALSPYEKLQFYCEQKYPALDVGKYFNNGEEFTKISIRNNEKEIIDIYADEYDFKIKCQSKNNTRLHISMSDLKKNFPEIYGPIKDIKEHYQICFKKNKQINKNIER